MEEFVRIFTKFSKNNKILPIFLKGFSSIMILAKFGLKGG